MSCLHAIKMSNVLNDDETTICMNFAFKGNRKENEKFFPETFSENRFLMNRFAAGFIGCTRVVAELIEIDMFRE